MSRYMKFQTKSLVGMGVAATLLAGCATNQGTVAPPLPIPLASAQGYAQQKQQGINVTRQFVGLWANAKHSMQANFANCLAVSNANNSSPDACWRQLKSQATGYANQFSGLYASGLQPDQQQHFAMARQSAVTYFQLLETYSKQCIDDLSGCMRKQDPTKIAIKDAKDRVNQLLSGTVTSGSIGAGVNFESSQVNNGLSGLSNSPAAVAPSAQVPALQDVPSN
ncbi:hypothetical protein H7F10_09070 [Acidithiobacillus sp. HP-6]|uniref:hypothetical protein n=1 Tax=unclassified Acidithiobacillus TaxID=2614800 RepID=UPI0018791BDC|nr:MULTISPECIES: hypothetical protein [unclassified Acidithiobacillus]MBE7563097.1 hypothetical protein [Acidithiobacillus sp. HP-6]MBE7570594.1 hypothetical protein [Acidithiobacillus sp. HP-2]